MNFLSLPDVELSRRLERNKMRDARFRKSKPKAKPENEDKITRFEEFSFRIAYIWRKFHKKYPDDNACWADIAENIVSGRLHKCRRCRKRDFSLTKNVKVIQCNGCGQKLSVSAGTFFHKVRKIRVWMAAIWLVQHGETVSSTFFAFLCEIAQSSALHILKSVYTVTEGWRCRNSGNVSSKHFLSWFMRRSSETPRKEAPAREEKIFQDEELARLEKESNKREITEDKIAIKDLGEVEVGIFEMLIPGPMSVEQIALHTGLKPAELLSTFTLLEILEIIRPLPGGLIGLCPGAQEKVYGLEDSAKLVKDSIVKNACLNASCAACFSEEQATQLALLLAQFRMFSASTFVVCSRKHFHYYLSVFAYISMIKAKDAPACGGRVKSSLDTEESEETLLNLCLRRGYVGSRFMYSNVTPLLLRAPLQDEAC